MAVDLFHTPGWMMAWDWRHARAESAKGGWQHPSTYATAYDASCKIAKFSVEKRSTKVALRVQSHVACLLVMFFNGRLAMPCMRRENVRHATLLFCAGSVNVRTNGAGEEDDCEKESHKASDEERAAREL